jgi:hypothetical protein
MNFNMTKLFHQLPVVLVIESVDRLDVLLDFWYASLRRLLAGRSVGRFVGLLLCIFVRVFNGLLSERRDDVSVGD